MSDNNVNSSSFVDANIVSNSKLDVREIRKISFWVSQFFILAATITGVYLAANQGFKQAIAYEKLMSDKSSYYLRLSLKDELTENVQLVKSYMERIQKGGVAARKAPFKLESFVWDAMKFSSATLEIPSPLLTASRNFHRQVAEIQEKVATLTYGVDHANKELQALVDNLEQNALPAMVADIEQLRQHLTTNNIAIQ